jgi:hypothetical protein
MEAWPLYNGVPQFPWRDTRYVYLVDSKSAETFTLVLSTWRGIKSVGELAQAVVNIRTAHPGATPIVRMTEPAADRYGIKPKPKFIVTKWNVPSATRDSGQAPLDEIAS